MPYLHEGARQLKKLSIMNNMDQNIIKECKKYSLDTALLAFISVETGGQGFDEYA